MKKHRDVFSHKNRERNPRSIWHDETIVVGIFLIGWTSGLAAATLIPEKFATAAFAVTLIAAALILVFGRKEEK